MFGNQRCFGRHADTLGHTKTCNNLFLCKSNLYSYIHSSCILLTQSQIQILEKNSLTQISQSLRLTPDVQVRHLWRLLDSAACLCLPLTHKALSLFWDSRLHNEMVDINQTNWNKLVAQQPAPHAHSYTYTETHCTLNHEQLKTSPWPPNYWYR